MREIVTVTGTITAADIGFCQFHEHLLIRKGRSFEVNPALCMEDIDKSTEEVRAYKAAGGSTLIDAQPGGCGRMADGLEEISKVTGVHIICSTGFHKMVFYAKDHWIFSADEDQIREFFVQELTEGVHNECDKKFSERIGRQKAGIIKCALDQENLTPQYEKLFRAAAETAVKTERTMMIHIEKGSNPVMLQQWLMDRGVDPKTMVFCHLDRAVAKPEIYSQILRNGSYLEFDTIGRFKYHSDEQEIEKILRLLNEGYEDQLLFSLDTTRERLRAYDPKGVGLTYILDTFLDKMMQAGITKEQIEKISNKNCIRALTGS